MFTFRGSKCFPVSEGSILRELQNRKVITIKTKPIFKKSEKGMSIGLSQQQTGPRNQRPLSPRPQVPNNQSHLARTHFYFRFPLSKDPKLTMAGGLKESHSILPTPIDPSGPLYCHPLLPQRTPAHLTCTKRFSATRSIRALPLSQVFSFQPSPSQKSQQRWDWVGPCH